MELKKVFAAIAALTATAVAVKVVGDIIEAEKTDSIIDLDQIAKEKQKVEVSTETKKD